MMNKLTGILLAGVISIGSTGSLTAEEETKRSMRYMLYGAVFAAENFSATTTFTTNYTYRGTTFSGEEPALQGSLDWSYGPWFAGMWGSSTDNTNQNREFTKVGIGGELEIDYYVGWADTIGDFDLMVMPLLYTFPGQDGPAARNDTTFELWTSIGRSFEFIGSPYVNLEVNWSPEFFDNGDDAYYIKPSIAFTLPKGFGLSFAYGYQDVGGAGSNDFFVDDYKHIEVGLTKSVAGFDLDLRYHDNLDDTTIGDGFALDQELVFTISRSF